MSEKIDFSEIIENGETQCLGRVSQKKQYHLEITLNAPPTPHFNNLLSSKQELYYRKWYRSLNGFIQNNIGDIEHLNIVFEYGEKNGKLHLHGVLVFKPRDDYFTDGIIQDIAKLLLQYLPGKHKKFLPGYYYPQYKRFKSPSVTIQMSDDKTRLRKWLTYMTKCNPSFKSTADLII